MDSLFHFSLHFSLFTSLSLSLTIDLEESYRIRYRRPEEQEVGSEEEKSLVAQSIVLLRAFLPQFKGFGTERARLVTKKRGFGTERARLVTRKRGFGTERARLDILEALAQDCALFDIF